jgi:SAM-dependent methyltransferase
MIEVLPYGPAFRGGVADELGNAVRAYWNGRIHDAGSSDSTPGEIAFFRDLDAYKLEKLDYLPRVVNFAGWAGRDVLEIGCGIGLDLMRFARGDARAVGIDLSESAIRLAQDYFRLTGESASLFVGDGAMLPFPDGAFDLVYCHGVLPYAADVSALIREAHRVLRVGGEAVLMTYNRRSWLALLSRATGVPLAHADAPVFRTSTRAELRRACAIFDDCAITTERLPVPTKLHSGRKAALFNRVFVPATRLLPLRLLRPWGWHLLAFCRKRR